MRLPKLRRLKLHSTGLTSAVVPLLNESTRLEELRFFGTKIGERGLATLRRALPKASIRARGKADEGPSISPPPWRRDDHPAMGSILSAACLTRRVRRHPGATIRSE